MAGRWSSWGYWLHWLAIRIGYEVCESQVEFLKCSGLWGWQVESGMKQCGCQVGFLRYAAMLGWPKSSMNLCGWCMKIPQHLAIWASKQNQVWDTWLTGGITAMGAGKSIRYDAEGLACGVANGLINIYCTYKHYPIHLALYTFMVGFVYS